MVSRDPELSAQGPGVVRALIFSACLGAASTHSLLLPPTFPAAMTLNDVDPSTLELDDRALSKISRKELAKHLSVLQDMYARRGKKYGTYTWLSQPLR